MHRSQEKLRSDALRIWNAGVDRVRSDRLIGDAVSLDGNVLLVDEDPISLEPVQKIAVVGAGKAGAGMAAALEKTLGTKLLQEKHVCGWINVPDDCAGPLEAIHLHAARPAGCNEPTHEGVRGCQEILKIVESLGPDDLCIALISGGGSALLPAPAKGITLEDKLAITRHLSAAGANIDQLNTVRKALSSVKGGGLARACRAGRLISLIVSDVLSDPLDLIASGPTVENRSTGRDALDVLHSFSARSSNIRPEVFEFLENQTTTTEPVRCDVTNYVIGNNALCVDAAGVEAEKLGYSHAMISASQSEGAAEEVGHHLAEMAIRMRDEPGPDCLISGGEPTVKLVDESRRGRGGRNQQLVLAAAMRLGSSESIALLSGGTDGEDGPTDAAGALVDEQILKQALRLKLNPREYLEQNNAYRFFEPLDGLIKTGPTHTNVCDLRVVTVARD